MAARTTKEQPAAVDVDEASGEVFQQRHTYVVKLRMNDGMWETHLETTSEDKAEAFIAEQRKRFPRIPADHWGLFSGEVTRIELWIG